MFGGKFYSTESRKRGQVLVFARMLPQSLCCTPLLKAPDEVPSKRLKTDVSFIVMNPLNTCSMTCAGALPTCPATAECWAEDAISAAEKQRVTSDGSSFGIFRAEISEYAEV